MELYSNLLPISLIEFATSLKRLPRHLNCLWDHCWRFVIAIVTVRRKLYYYPRLRTGFRIGMRLSVSCEICVLVGSLLFQCTVHYTGWLALLCWIFNPLHPLFSLLLQWAKPTIECPTAPGWPPPISTTSSRPSGIGYWLSWLWISSVSLISACTG